MDSLLTYSWPSKPGTTQRAGARRPSIATCLNGNPRNGNSNGASDILDKTPTRKLSAINLTISPAIDDPRPSAATLVEDIGIDRKDMGIDRKASVATLVDFINDRKPSSTATLVGSHDRMASTSTLIAADHNRRPSAATLAPHGSQIDIRRPSMIPEYGPPSFGSRAPQLQEPYFILPSRNFSLHEHLKFNPAPQGPQCNCGTWQMWCLPPHLGGCGHMYVQMQIFCGKTVDDDEPHKAMATSCLGVVMKRPIRCAAYVMGLCPTCRTEASVIQTYNSFIAPFFVPKGLTGLKLADAEDKANLSWKAHRIAFDSWIQQLRQEGQIKDIP